MGGDHYGRDRPVRQGRKGKGEGWCTIDSKNVHWSSWNPVSCLSSGPAGDDCVDDATKNMENGENISQRSVMMKSDVNSKHSAPERVHMLQRVVKKVKSIRVCSEGEISWQCTL